VLFRSSSTVSTVGRSTSSGARGNVERFRGSLTAATAPRRLLEPTEEHLDLLPGLQVAGPRRHLEPLLVRGPGRRDLARSLQRATEPPVRSRVIRFQPDRLPELIGRVLGLPCVEVRPGEAEPHDGVVRYQLDDLLELRDAIRLGHPRYCTGRGGHPTVRSPRQRGDAWPRHTRPAGVALAAGRRYYSGDAPC